ncbi:hypothetical protein SDC9_149054 [bioreactor metagenome]|uniref:Uncharacterized protein n=1 Tax=bioreactor metagenome TaxID=1076179 RepID=A0A645EKP6_9ZZZZ
MVVGAIVNEMAGTSLSSKTTDAVPFLYPEASADHTAAIEKYGITSFTTSTGTTTDF